MIALRGLEKRYGRRRALAGIDLRLDAREIVGIVGPDGAGKSTLLRALAGLLDVEAREATVLGFDLRRDTTPLKARIGYVPQTFGLHPDLTVEENLRFTARLHRLPAAELRTRAEELLARTGLAPFAGRAAGALSGGMKQKLAIANALLPRPALLLLDEPTAGVDVLARAEIWSLLERERGHALVCLSTSYLDEAAACDRLLYLDRGRLVASGTPAELRAAVPVEVYRAWGDDVRAFAGAARGLAYVEAARATGRFVRIDVRRDRTPGAARVLRDVAALAGGAVRFAERADVDMESALVALAPGG
jgi:ABC-2 type transport system ATP-binding protein